MKSGKDQEAVRVFEKFVNTAFEEAAEMKLPVGQLPPLKRPAEYQWLQYIQALDRCPTL